MIRFSDDLKKELIQLAAEKEIFLEGNITKIIDTDGHAEFHSYIQSAINRDRENRKKRLEITKTIQEISLKVKNNLISPSDINESIINNHLYTRDLPDVDLLIRTSGEQRISNFLLWQIAYAELHFTETLWPDYTKGHLYNAILDYQNRERRFGKTSEQLNA